MVRRRGGGGAEAGPVREGERKKGEGRCTKTKRRCSWR